MEHSQRFSSFSVRSALARLSLGATLLFACLTAQAGILINNFAMYWDNPDTIRESGGTATISWSLENNYAGDKSFQVSVAPFTTALITSGNGIQNWITPLKGSGVDFTSMDLLSITGRVDQIYNTPNGPGQALGWHASEGLIFSESNEYTGWEITLESSPVAAIPEPGNIALISIGLLSALAATRRRAKKSR